MKLYSVVRIGVRVLLSVVGVGVAVAASVCAGLPGCGPVAVRALQPGQPVRASKLWSIVPPAPAPVVLPASPAGRPAWQLAQVKRVVDGDTYDVLVGVASVRVRLQNVDAPETTQPFGKQATDSVRVRLVGKYVWLLSAGGDAYGRTLARVRLRPVAFSAARAVSMDSLMVVRGWAWAYNPGSQTAEWAVLQQQATTVRRGLWKCGAAGVVRPGVWRAFNAKEKASAWVGCPW